MSAAGGQERESQCGGQDEAGRADHAAAYYPPPVNRPWVALAAGIALLAGCGGGDKPDGRAVTLPAGRELRVVADEYSFDPEKVTIEQPGELRITLRNEGRLPHDLHVMRGDREVGGTPVFEGGMRSARVGLTRGRYKLVCTVGNHAELGMLGTLEVR